MRLSLSRSITTFPALFALACAPSTPEAVRPVADGAAAVPVASVVDVPARPAARGGGLVMSRDACESDADCVPATCCHASACMSREKATPCDVMCTQVCQPGTIDCGGTCLCHEGRCAARLGNGGN